MHARVVETDSQVSEYESFIGVAEQSVPAGQKCRVTVTGGITRQFSGLTPGRKYYVNEDGELTRDKTCPLIGKAIQADELLIME